MIGSINAISGLVDQSCNFCVIESIPSMASWPRGGTACPRRVDGTVAQATATFHVVLTASDGTAVVRAVLVARPSRGSERDPRDARHLRTAAALRWRTR